jgi:dynactin-6
MRIGDDNLFEIGARTFISISSATHPSLMQHHRIGIESPTIGSFNTISTKSRVHHTVRISNHCTIGPRVLLVPAEDEVLEEYAVVYGPDAERRIWSGRGKAQEADLRRKHGEYLREMLPKFNRLRKSDAI